MVWAPVSAVSYQQMHDQRKPRFIQRLFYRARGVLRCVRFTPLLTISVNGTFCTVSNISIFRCELALPVQHRNVSEASSWAAADARSAVCE